jgi:hypothetical protein
LWQEQQQQQHQQDKVSLEAASDICRATTHSREDAWSRSKAAAHVHLCASAESPNVVDNPLKPYQSKNTVTHTYAVMKLTL